MFRRTAAHDELIVKALRAYARKQSKKARKARRGWDRLVAREAARSANVLANGIEWDAASAAPTATALGGALA